MFKNYLVIAFRNQFRSLGYTSINVVGLAIGLACCLLVTIYVRYELSYEDFQGKKQHIYRYIARSERDGQVRMQTYLPAGFAPLMKDQFREIEMFTRYGFMDDRPVLRSGETFLDPQPFVLGDRDFFNIFSFPFVAGDPSTALSSPNTIVIAESIAKAYFPNGDAVGKTLRYDNAFDLEIAGVFKDLPTNTHLSFSYITSFETASKMYQQIYNADPERFLTSLDAWNFDTYFYIPQTNDIDALAVSIDKKFTEARKDPFNPNVLGDWLQPLTEIHFTRGIAGDTANGNINYIYIFSAVALLILVIACFNFMNLSTARAMKRAKEVGLRKVMGAHRTQLIRQFLAEAFVMVMIALVFSIFFLELMVPAFVELTGQPLKVVYWGEGSLVWLLALAGAITAVLAGSYPAFYLSSFYLQMY